MEIVFQLIIISQPSLGDYQIPMDVNVKGTRVGLSLLTMQVVKSSTTARLQQVLKRLSRASIVWKH